MDDNNNCVTRENNETPISHTLEESKQKWEKLLHASGETLELNKSLTYVVKWEQDQTRRHMISKDPAQIEIIDSQTQERKEIASKGPSESHKTLGCYKNPEMDSKALADDIKKKGRKNFPTYLILPAVKGHHQTGLLKHLPPRHPISTGIIPCPQENS